MSGNRPIKVRLRVDNRTFTLGMVHLTGIGTTLLATRPFEEYALTPGTLVRIIIPIPVLDIDDTLDGMIDTVTTEQTDQGDRYLIDVVFKSLTQQNLSTIDAYLSRRGISSDGPRTRPSQAPVDPAIENLPIEAYRCLFDSDAFSDAQRDELFGLMSEEERAFLESGGKDILGDLVGLKLKLKYEESLFQRYFSSTEQYVRRVNDITFDNGRLAVEWLDSIDKTKIPEECGRLFKGLLVEIQGLYSSQLEYARTCKELLKEWKEAERNARLSSNAPGRSSRFPSSGPQPQAPRSSRFPSSGPQPQTPESSDAASSEALDVSVTPWSEVPRLSRTPSTKPPKTRASRPSRRSWSQAPRPPAGRPSGIAIYGDRRRVKVLATTFFLLLSVGFSGYQLFGKQLAASMLPRDLTIQSIRTCLPIARGQHEGDELFLYLTPDVDVDGLKEDVSKALGIARKNGFKGIRVFTRTGQPLYITVHSEYGSRLIRMPN